MTVNLYIRDPKDRTRWLRWCTVPLSWSDPVPPSVVTVANRVFVRGTDAMSRDGLACYLEATCCDASQLDKDVA